MQTFESIAKEKAMLKVKVAPEPMLTEVIPELSQKLEPKIIKSDQESPQRQSRKDESEKQSQQKVIEDVEIIEIDEDPPQKHDPKSPQKLKKLKNRESKMSQNPSKLKDIESDSDPESPPKKKKLKPIESESDPESPPKLKKLKPIESESDPESPPKHKKLKPIESDPESPPKHKQPKVTKSEPESSEGSNLSDKIFKIMESENCPLTTPAIVAKVGSAYDKKIIEKMLQEQVTEGKLISKLCGKLAIYCINKKQKAGAVSA